MSPRRYGFHATLKPPMRLTGALEAFVADVRAVVRGRAAFVMPALRVARFGYPCVLEDWRFHMTLSDSGAPDEMLAAAEAFFAGVLGTRVIDSVGVFVEWEAGGEFCLVERVGFAG